MATTQFSQKTKDNLSKLAEIMHGLEEEGVLKEIDPQIADKIGKLAHGGLVGSAHPGIIKELYEAEILQTSKDKIGKLAHGGLIGSAHPAIIEEFEQADIKK